MQSQQTLCALANTKRIFMKNEAYVTGSDFVGLREKQIVLFCVCLNTYLFHLAVQKLYFEKTNSQKYMQRWSRTDRFFYSPKYIQCVSF